MPALDARPLDRTARAGLNAYQDAAAERQRKIDADELALEIARENQERARAEDARKASEETAKQQLPIGADDVVQWQTSDPRYQVPFHEAPQEVRDHFINARRYDPSAAAQIPKLWNESLPNVTGKIPGLDPSMEPAGTQVSGEGKINRTFVPKKPVEGVTFKNADEAEAAGYSAEGAEVLPGGQGIRITKMARVDKSRGKFTEAESKSILYLDRMASAEKGLKAIMDAGYDPTSTKNSIMRGAAGTIANPLADEKTQQYENEQRNFLAGVLRKDTGAAVTDGEFKLYGPMFFPTWGDKPATVTQKEAKRKVAVDAIRKGLSSDLIIKQVSPADLPPAAKPPTATTSTPRTPAAPASDRITVISPDGKTGSIPKSQLSEAIAAGYKTK